MAPSIKQFPNLEKVTACLRCDDVLDGVSKHQGNATDTWLPGDEDHASAVCVWKENSISLRKTRQPRQMESITCETDKLPLSGHMHTYGLATRAPAHRARLLLVRCHRCLLGGLFCHPGVGGFS